jgi:hypothetical protein
MATVTVIVIIIIVTATVLVIVIVILISKSDKCNGLLIILQTKLAYIKMSRCKASLN